MYKKTLIFFLLFISANPYYANAQFIKSYGLKTGFHFSNHIWNYSDSFLDNYYNMPPKSRFLFELGVFGEFFSHKYLSFVSEFNIFPKGAGFEYNKKDANGNTIGKGKVIAQVNYFSFAEKLKARYGNKNGSLYCFTGLTLELIFLRSDDADLKKVYEKFKSPVIAAVFGIGLEYKRFLIESQYDLDITNSISSEKGSIKNYIFSFRIGFKFGKLKNMY